MSKNLYLTRDELIDIIGQQAEQVVYEFCSIPDPRSQNILLYPDEQVEKRLDITRQSKRGTNEWLKLKHFILLIILLVSWQT